MDGVFAVLSNTMDASKIVSICYVHPSTSIWMRPDAHGFSHGLNKCPPDTCLHQCAHWCRPFESYLICANALKGNLKGKNKGNFFL